MTDQDSEADDPPEPDRTVIVEEAHLLADQIEIHEQSYEDADDEQEATYHQQRVKETQRLKAEIEGDGLREQAVEEMLADAKDQIEADDTNPEPPKLAAKQDTALHVLTRYFGHNYVPQHLDLGDLAASSSLGDNIVELEGTKNTAEMRIVDEGMGRATAEAFLDAAGIDPKEMQSGVTPL